jgi:hypothetical protein
MISTRAIALACYFVVLTGMVAIGAASESGSFAGVGMRATASSGEKDLGPECAIDGEVATRWSSAFNDREWYQVTFDEPVTLSGVRILWETAYAEKYSVMVSEDGVSWQTVYEVEEGDGGPDVLFFKPVKVMALKIKCRQRGTGWGNSIWDIKFFNGDQRLQASATSQQAGSEADCAVDGRLDTAWRPTSDFPSVLTVTLPERMYLGGLEINWGDGFASDYEVKISQDGEAWTSVATVHGGNGGADLHYFPSVSANFIRLEITNSSSGGVPALARLECKSGEEQATPIRHYKAKVRNIRPDLLPMWLSRLQEYWTVVGVPEENQETLLSETGIVEPSKSSFSVQPMVEREATLFTWASVEHEVGLADGYLPIPWVRWSGAGWKLTIDAIMFGDAGHRWTAARYRYEGQSTTNEMRTRLALAFRPVQLNPAWQHGGFSPIPDAQVGTSDSGMGWFNISGKPRALFVTRPTSAGVAILAEGEIGEFLARGEVPSTAFAADAEGKVGAGAWFDLTNHHEVVVLFPLNEQSEPPEGWREDPSTAFEEAWQDERAAWTKWLAHPVIDIPEKKLIDVMKSNVGYIMINRDGPWFKPGPRNYNHAWMRDGVLTGLAVMRNGDTAMVRRFIEAFAGHIRPDGWVPWMILENGQPVTYNPDPNNGEGHEYDSQGQFPFIVRNYLEYSGNEEFARAMYPKVMAALHFADMLCKRRMTDIYRNDPSKKAYFGILPHSNSHEGYYPARHSYWDGFWLLRGIKDATVMAERFGFVEDAAWLRNFENTCREHLYASILAVVEGAQLESIPGCVELADFDPTSTAIAIMVADERDYLPRPYGTNTFSLYWEELAKRIKSTESAKLYTPYEVRNADAFVRLGWRDRALEALRYFVRDGSRPWAWNQMAEVVHTSIRTPAYIGDMPHTWVGADYVNAVRSLFVYEDLDVLVLAAGVDPGWLQAGVKVADLPTEYGVVGYAMHVVDGTLNIEVNGDAQPPGGFVLHLPKPSGVTRIILNGEVLSSGLSMTRFATLQDLGALNRRDEELVPADPAVLSWLKRVQDTTTPEKSLLGSMQDGQLQTFNNALAAMAFILSEEPERARRILDFYAAAIDRDNHDPLRQNLYYRGELRGFYQSAERHEDDGKVVYRVGSMNDRWMGDLFWLLLAYHYHDRTYGPGRYEVIKSLLHNLCTSWYRSLPDGSGYVQHGWRRGDAYLHETQGHHEGNLDALAYYRLIGDEKRADELAVWLDRELSGKNLPLDLYTWRALVEGSSAHEALSIPDRDTRFRKTVEWKGRPVCGVWHRPDPAVTNNFWNDGLGHMACGYFAVGDMARGNFYANQLDALLIDVEIDGEAVRSIPYTLHAADGFEWVDESRGFVSTAAWYLFAKNRFNPMTLHRVP